MCPAAVDSGGASSVEAGSVDAEPSSAQTDLDDRWLCPECRQGWLIRIETLAPIERPFEVEGIDSS